MMEPACRFCRQEMNWVTTHLATPHSPGPHPDKDIEVYRCHSCKSTQEFLMVEPTCYFCQNKLTHIAGSSLFSKTDFQLVSTTTNCPRCHANQTYDPNGKPLRFTFVVSPYVMVFDMEHNNFTIREESKYDNILMTCNYIPKNMTPQNTTLEKIKTLILFS